MSKMIVYIASTLDGYIARKNGSVDRLNNFPNPDNLDYGYNDFVKNTDTIIMGNNTYTEILKFDGDWPYKDHNIYVVTRDPDLKLNTPNTQMLTGLPPEKIKKLCDKSQKDVWILGGGDVISQCLDSEIIDEMIITIIPIVLGSGIRLFPEGIKESYFSLEKTESFPTGIVNLHYKKIV